MTGPAKSKRHPSEPSAGGPSGADVTSHSQSPFPIVRIGVSSAGLEGFTRLVSHLPPDTGMAFVLLQHLDLHPEWQLAERLAKLTAMPVIEAMHGMRVLPNRIYVIPPRASMTLTKGLLSIQPRRSMVDPVRGHHEPSDTREFLESMIDQQDVANEALRVANEEMLSTNEALNITNEELEMARDELHRRNV